MRGLIAAIILAVFTLFSISPLAAREGPDCIVKFGMSGPVCVATKFKQAKHFGTYTKAPKSVRKAIARQARRTAKPRKAIAAKKATPRTIKGYAAHQSSKPGRLSLNGFPAPLVSKVRQLERECGARVVSAFRPGAKVRGSGRPSLHASKRAVDMSGDPRCIYARMNGWKGGYSTDYRAVAHIHLSYAPGSGEWGARFAHWKPRRTGVGG